ncbi:MAG: hypothetical protein ACXWUN_01510, partial [Allosphingosinicella sp.]
RIAAWKAKDAAAKAGWGEPRTIGSAVASDAFFPFADGRLAAAAALADYLADDPDAVIVADWPEDIGHFCALITIGPGEMAAVGPLRFELMTLPGFSTAANSAVPHNALHDARALREFVLEGESI